MDFGRFHVVFFMFAHVLNRSMKAYEPPLELGFQANVFINQDRP